MDAETISFRSTACSRGLDWPLYAHDSRRSGCQRSCSAKSSTPWKADAGVASGNVYLTGYFDGVANFGGLPLTSVGTSDIFLAS